MFDSYFRKDINWGGKTLTLETGKMARQADGAVHVVRGGDIDTVDVPGFFFQKFPPVLVALHAREPLFHPVKIPSVHVTHSSQFPHGVIRHRAEIRPGHAGSTESGMAEFSVRRSSAEPGGDEGRSNNRTGGTL
jgi:hypothetical protein